MTRCSILPVASPLHDAPTVTAIVDRLRPAFHAADVDLVTQVEQAAPAHPFAILVLTGGTEQRVLETWRQRQQLAAGEPLLLVAHPDQNSLPAALEALARVQQDGARGRIVTVDDLHSAIADLAVWHALHRARLGLVGTPSDWLVASTPDHAAVTRRWGPQIVEIDLPATLRRYATTTEAPLAMPVRVGARHVHEPTQGDILAAARFEPALREVVNTANVDAVTVRCFDLVTEAHTSGCLALSALNDDGIIAGCEGDVASTIGLMWAKHLTGHLGWMANPAAIDTSTGVVELAHCTVPRSLVSGYELRSHFESGLGVGIAGDLPPGPVTLLRVGGRELELLWCADGEALATVPREGRCRTQLDVRIPPDAAAELLERPLGNHIVVVAGHHAAQLRGWWQRMIAD